LSIKYENETHIKDVKVGYNLTFEQYYAWNDIKFILVSDYKNVIKFDIKLLIILKNFENFLIKV
jgi:hypothetical protein